MTVQYNHRNGIVYSCRFIKSIKHPLRKHEKQKITKTWSIPAELQFSVKPPEGKENKPLNSNDVSKILKTNSKLNSAIANAVDEFEEEILKLIKGTIHDGETTLVEYMEYKLAEIEKGIANKLEDAKSESHATKVQETINLVRKYLGPKIKLKELSVSIFKKMFEELKNKNIAKTKAVLKSNADVKGTLKKLGLTQDAFCALTGISHATFINAIKQINIEVGIAEAIAKGLRLPSKDVFTFVSEAPRRYKRSTLAKYRGVLYGILNAAESEGIITNNYLDAKYKLMPTKTAIKAIDEQLILTKQEAMLTLNEINKIERVHKPKAIALTIMLFTGMRRAELLGLTVNDIDLIKKEIPINKGRMYASAKYGVVKRDTTKNKKPRKVPISNELLPYLKRYLEWYANKKSLVGWESDYLIINPEDYTPISPRTINTWVDEVIESVGIKKAISPHKLRHTAASIMISEKIEDGVIADILGHSVNTLRLYYAHAYEDDKKSAMDKFGQLIGGGIASDDDE